jgi:hypothetical protein
MSHRRRSFRTVLKRVGRAALDGLTAMGSCWCGGYGLIVGVRPGARCLDEHGDVEVRDQASRGIAEIEAYLATVDSPPPVEHRKRHRHGGETA